LLIVGQKKSLSNMPPKPPELPEWLVVGFAGHRDIGTAELIAAKIGDELDRLASTFRRLTTISSAANGADSLFLEEVNRRNIPYLIILPFPRERFAKDFSSTDWERVSKQLKSALEVEEISAPGNEGYWEVAERTIEQADVVLVVWDGQPAAGMGGTGDAVAFARTMSKPLIWIHPDTQEVKREGFEKLSQPKGTDSDLSLPGTPREIVQKYFLKIDETAARRGPQTRRLMQRLIWLHLAASSVGLSTTTFGLESVPEFFLLASELALLATAFVLAGMHHRKHGEWLRLRIEAEICRSYLATWGFRSQLGGAVNIAVHGFEAICKNLGILQALDGNRPASLKGACDDYLTHRLRSQLDYFSQWAEKAQRAHARLQIFVLCCTAAAALLTATVLGLAVWHVDGLPFKLSKFLSLTLPLLSAALISIIITHGYARRAERYREIIPFLENSTKRLSAVKTWSGLIRIASETEEVLLREVIEWHSFTRFTGRVY